MLGVWWFLLNEREKNDYWGTMSSTSYANLEGGFKD